MTKIYKSWNLFLAIILSQIVLITAAEVGRPLLLRSLPSAEERQLPDLNGQISNGRIIRSVIINVDKEDFFSEVIVLDLFGDESISFANARIEDGVNKMKIWSAANDPLNSATIVLKGDRLMGTIRFQGKLYRLIPLKGSNKHALIEIDQSSFVEHPEE